MSRNKVESLSKIKLLSELDLRELEELADDFHWEEYPVGSDIIRQGQDRYWFYVLVEGRAESLFSKKGGCLTSNQLLCPG